MMRFRDFSIKTKLTILGASSSASALALGCVGFAGKDMRFSLFVIVLALSAVVFFISCMQKYIARPILRLSETAQRILAEGDYSIRPSWDCEDEIGGLHMAFNLLLDQIEASESALQRAHAELAQQRALARTAQLSDEIAGPETTDVDLSPFAPRQNAPFAERKATMEHACDVAAEANLAMGEPLEILASTLPTDDADFREIVEEFVDRLHQQVGAMQRALSRGDLDELARLAHWLKGAGGSAGFPALTAPAKHLETVVKLDQCDEIENAIQELLKITARIVKPSQSRAAC